MPLQNRVTPTSEIVADPARGTLMGNRGILHDNQRRLGSVRWRHRHWVACVLSFKGRSRQVMTPHRFTELFFLDEPTALAAGHRPCCECRRPDFLRFQAAWRRAFDTEMAKADAMDRVLHHARIESRTRRQIRFEAQLESLPDEVFVLIDQQACLVRGESLHPWSPNGYGPPRARHAGRVLVLTPSPIVDVLQAGYRPIRPDVPA